MVHCTTALSNLQVHHYDGRLQRCASSAALLKSRLEKRASFVSRNAIEKPAASRHAALESNAQPIAQPKPKRRQTASQIAIRPTEASCRSTSSQAKTVTDTEQLFFERHGFLLTPGFLDHDVVAQLKREAEQHVANQKLAALQHRVRVLCPDVKDPASLKTERQALAALKRKATDSVGFLQFFNLHRINAFVQQLVSNRRLASTAAALLGVKRLHLYQDCLFLKEPGFSETNWHSDLRMAPFDTNSYVTVWIPLRPISGADKDSGLLFASGSHRDFALPFWHNLDRRSLDDRGYEVVPSDVFCTGPMQLGDVSWHHGWTLHCAGPQPKATQPRLALSISYFADGARLLARKSDPSVHKRMLHSEDAESFEDWVKQLKDGAVARHAKLPLVYP